MEYIEIIGIEEAPSFRALFIRPRLFDTDAIKEKIIFLLAMENIATIEI